MILEKNDKNDKNSKNKRRDGDLNPGDLLIIGLAVRRRTRLGHPDIQMKKSYDKLLHKIQHYYFIFTYYINFFFYTFFKNNEQITRISKI